MVMVDLKNKPKELHGACYGVYTMDSEEVNGKPTWVMGEVAMWFTEKKRWVIGEKCDLGTIIQSINCKKYNAQSPYLSNNTWDYVGSDYSSYDPGDITVTRIEGKTHIELKVWKSK